MLKLIYGSLVLSCVYALNSTVEKDHPFDLLIFTQSWPPTACKEWKKENPAHTCAMPKKDDIWTIHGVWPTKLGTIGPAFCNRTWLFDPEQVRPIEDELSSLWTNIFAGTSVYSLWAHEWTKHGTCAAVLEHFNSEFKYFSTGLDWKKTYSMSDILSSSNILPSNTKGYSLDDIRNAVVTKLGVRPEIECKKIDGQSYLSEIRICFSKNLKLKNCDGILGLGSVLTNCDTSEEIMYLHYSSSDTYRYLLLQLYRITYWLQLFTL